MKNRFAVVRYMFFNPGDVAYFRPLELFTKHGCIGAWADPFAGVRVAGGARNAS